MLYVQIMGELQPASSNTDIHYRVHWGFPTTRFEWLLGFIWNLIIILAGIMLIVSASSFPAAESFPRYTFLPMIYGVYGLRLLVLYRRVVEVVPQILSACRKGE